MDTVGLTIAMLTYQRNGYLKEVLPQLVAQADATRGQGASGHSYAPVRVLVVDNNPDGSAASTVEEAARAARATSPQVEVVYVHEPEPGIVSARNRALAASSEQDLLVFLDDDAVPQPGWLEALLEMRERTGAQAVTGPTPPRYEAPPSPWVRASGVFDSWSHEDGARLGSAETANLLLDLRAVRRLGLSFDPRYNLSGGEDSLFTRRLVKGGGVVRFATGAVVVKRVPAARATRSWALYRAFRTGTSWARVRVDTKDGARLPLRVGYAAKGLARAVVEALGAGGALVRGDIASRAAHEVRGAGGLGMVLGAFGADVQEYARKKPRGKTEQDK